MYSPLSIAPSFAIIMEHAVTDFQPASTTHLLIVVGVEILSLPLCRNPFLARQTLPLPFLQTVSFHANVTPLLTRFNALLPEELANGYMSTLSCLFTILDERLKRCSAGLELRFFILSRAASAAIALSVAAVAIVSCDAITGSIAVLSRVE